MKNLNKILAMVIVLAMALSTVAFAGTFTDVTADASYSEAVEVMAALGLLAGYEDGSFGPDKTITRAEFAAVIVRAIGMEDSAKGSYGATNFSDVKADDWFAGYVMIAAQQKIVNGYPDGTFQPNKEVKFEEAVKMIVCALGYAPKFADVADAYPTAYIAQAHTSGITTGANLAIGTDASRAVVARLVYNALDVGKMEQTTFGTEKEWAVPTYAKTLLSENLNVAKVKGYVSAISFSNEDGNKLQYVVARDGMAKQFDTAYDLYYPNAALGTSGSTLNIEYAEGVALKKYYATTAFVDMTDDTNPVVLAIIEQAGKNETLTITGTQAEKATFDFTNKKVGYFKTSSDVDSKQTEVKLAPSAKIYKNLNAADETNTAITTFAAAYSLGKFPVVTLIDNDNTVNGYEVVYATEYYSAVVDEIYDRSYRITFSDGFNQPAAITLNPTADDYTFSIVDEEGNAIAFEDIKVDDVLNVSTSVDGTSRYYEVVVTSTKLEGAVDEVVDASHYVIGDEEYYSTIALEAGDSGIFFVDMYGKILKHELSADSNRNFAILYAVYEDKNGVDNEPKAILYTADGQFVTYGFAKNVNVNGTADDPTTTTVDETTKYNSIQKTAIKDNVDPALAFAAVGGTAQKIVMYTVNSSDLISELYWADGVARRDSNYKVNAIAGAVDADSDGKFDGVSYRDTSSKLASVIIPEDFTFVTLEDTTYQSTLDKTNFGTADSSILVDDDNTTYVVQFVENTKEDVAAFGILFDCKASVASDADVMFVTNVGSSENSEGSPATKITGFVNGEKVSVIATNGETVIYNGAKAVSGAIADITKGAMIQVTGEGEAQAIRILAKAGDYAAMNGKVFGGSDESDENIGYFYGDTLVEYKRGVAEFAGAEFSVKSGVPTMIVRQNGNVYVSDEIVFGVAETNSNVYDGVNTTNDDKVAIYFFDGEAVAAVIYDGANDDIWN